MIAGVRAGRAARGCRGQCDEDGTCAAGAPPACSTLYDPCAGKACGEPCAICPPHAPECVETAELKACDAGGRCVAATPLLDCPQ